jgi:hypothetical protein
VSKRLTTADFTGLAARLKVAELVLPIVDQPVTAFESHTPVPLNSRRPRFWLWLNLLSLDAPLVALAWQILFARCFDLALDFYISAALALAVWFIYVADRLLDTLPAGTLHAAPRHAFCRRNWSTMAVAALLGLFGLGVICTHLPAAVLRNGLLLLTAVMAYFVIVHSEPVHLGRFWSKELAVGAIFSLGTCLPVWSQIQSVGSETISAALLFAALCAMNCLAIEYWEWQRYGSLDNASASGLSIWIGDHYAPITLILAGLSALGLSLQPANMRPLFWSLLLSALALLWLWHQSHRLSEQALRVLADLALMSPVLAFCFF